MSGKPGFKAADTVKSGRGLSGVADTVMFRTVDKDPSGRGMLDVADIVEKGRKHAPLEPEPRNPNPHYQAHARRGDTWQSDPKYVENPAAEIRRVGLQDLSSGSTKYSDSIPVNKVKDFLLHGAMKQEGIVHFAMPNYPRATHEAKIDNKGNVLIKNMMTKKVENTLGPALTGPDAGPEGVKYFIDGFAMDKLKWLSMPKVQQELLLADANPPEFKVPEDAAALTHFVQWRQKNDPSRNGSSGALTEEQANHLVEMSREWNSIFDHEIHAIASNHGMDVDAESLNMSGPR